MSNVVKSSNQAVINEQQISSYVEEYSVCLRKSATAVLTLADCVYRAKNQLTKEEYSEFCKRIQVAENSSFLKKLNCIAQKATRFKAIEQLLPPNYTSLYSLTQVSDDNFSKMMSEQVISPQMTAKQISAYLESATKTKANVYEVHANLNTANALQLQLIVAKLENVLAEFKIELKKSPDLCELLKLSIDTDKTAA